MLEISSFILTFTFPFTEKASNLACMVVAVQNNLLKRVLIVKITGCLNSQTVIVFFPKHWDLIEETVEGIVLQPAKGKFYQYFSFYVFGVTYADLIQTA